MAVGNRVQRWRLRRAAYKALRREVPARPVTFNEKLLYRMAHDRHRVLTTFVDKCAVRDWVANRIDPKYLPHVYAVMERGDPVPWELLEDEFVAKAAHGSGGSVVVTRSAPRRLRLPSDGPIWWDRFRVHPEALVRPDLERLCAGWMNLDYELLPGRRPEWAYRGAGRRVLFEELLKSPDDRAAVVPLDFKFHVFGGHCEIIAVEYDRFGDHRRDHFTCEWERLSGTFVHPRSDAPQERPARWTR